MTIRSLKAAVLPLLAGTLMLAGCERPPVESVQHGFRGTGMVQVYNPRTVAKQMPANVPPVPLPSLGTDGPKAGEVYQNVKLLGSLSVNEFTRYMVSMTSWIAPVEGCAYCHELNNLADDSRYTKIVARRMIEMTQNVNSQHKSHVAETGVTCWTCHRGKAVPDNLWFEVPPQNLKANFIGDKAQQNEPGTKVGLTSLPYDPFTPYLVGQPKQIRVIGPEPLPNGNRMSIKQAEFTYGLMMHMSDALGVNCTYCHNSRSFASWEGPPQRVNAWHGLNMVRDINTNYIEPLKSSFPANRLGPMGDAGKANCKTCHQGAYKPMYGVSMLKDFPELAGPLPPFSKDGVTLTPGALSGTLAKVLFAVGRANITNEARASISSVAGALIANNAVKVDLSGFADKTGNADKNLELAKQRAFAVRDALKAAGVPEDRINLKKPEFVVGGTTDDARRVEINVAQ